MSTDISIIVNVGSLLDYARCRHTALFFEFGHGKEEEKKKRKATAMMHVVGAHGFFEFQQVDDVDPRRSVDFRTSIAVGTIPAVVPAQVVPAAAVPADVAATHRTAISNVVSQTAVLNDAANAEWNCQHWVADALSRMQSADWITRAQVSEAIDAMLSACSEATDVELE